VPEKLGPPPARNDQYVAVLGKRIRHGASALRPAKHACAAHRLCRLRRPRLAGHVRHYAWRWSRHGLNSSFRRHWRAAREKYRNAWR
jgi:hypothetical protein